MQREQHVVTVHLFIDAGRSLGRITFTSLTFTVSHKANYQGLSSLFSFRSVPSFTIISKPKPLAIVFVILKTCWLSF
jgi:hypothetical protein